MEERYLFLCQEKAITINFGKFEEWKGRLFNPWNYVAFTDSKTSKILDGRKINRSLDDLSAEVIESSKGKEIKFSLIFRPYFCDDYNTDGAHSEIAKVMQRGVSLETLSKFHDLLKKGGLNLDAHYFSPTIPSNFYPSCNRLSDISMARKGAFTHITLS